MFGFRTRKQVGRRKKRWFWTGSVLVVLVIGVMSTGAFAAQPIAGSYFAGDPSMSTPPSYTNFVTGVTKKVSGISAAQAEEEAGLQGTNNDLTFDWSAPGYQESAMGITKYYNPVLGINSTVSPAAADLNSSMQNTLTSGYYQTPAGYYLDMTSQQWRSTPFSGTTASNYSTGSSSGVAGTGGVTPPKNSTTGATSTTNGLNWFDDMLLGVITGPLSMITAIFNLAGFNVPDVIEKGMMYTPGVINNGTASTFGNVAFGSAGFSDILGGSGSHNQQAMNLFIPSFQWLAGMLLLLFIYTSAIRISRASTSVIQRDRLKNELVGLVGAGVFLAIGPHLAVMITQLSFASIIDMMNQVLSASSGLASSQAIAQGATTVTQASHVLANHTSTFQAFTSANTGNAPNPIVKLMNAIFGFIQSIAALILAILFGFRGIFVDVWIVLFPLAAVSYANENTKPFFKMWWTEWIFQMLVPVGQTIIYALSAGLVTMFGTSSQTALDVGDIFTSITGLIGFFFAAGYVRKIVDGVAATFRASTLGVSTSGGAVGAAIGMFAGDRVGSVTTRAALKPYTAAAGAGFKALDNTKMMRNMASKSLNAHPELAASHVAGGGTLETYMQAHRLGGSRGSDPLHFADGMGIPDADRQGSRTGGGNFSPWSAHRAHKHAMFHSDTAGVIRKSVSGGKDAVTHSNAALVARGLGESVRNQFRRSNPQLGAWQNQIKNTSNINTSQQRLSNLNGVYHPWSKNEPWSKFVGSSDNIEKYEKNLNELRQNATNATGVEYNEEEFRRNIETSFQTGNPNDSTLYYDAISSASGEDYSVLKQSYQNASAYYNPMQDDLAAIQDLEAGKLQWRGAIDVGDGKGTVVPAKIPITQQFSERLENMSNDYRARLLKTKGTSEKGLQPSPKHYHDFTTTQRANDAHIHRG